MRQRRTPAGTAAGGHRNDFRREDGQDQLVSSLQTARAAFQRIMVEEAALLAESMNPEWRGVARKILGISGGDFGPENEARIATMRKVVDGEPYAMFALAREMVADDEVDGGMRVAAGALVCMHCVFTLKQHAADPAASGEKELMEVLESIPGPIAGLVGDDLAIIARRSPYEDVRSAAKALVDQSE